MISLKILVDAMGGDNAPEAVVRGAVKAGKDFGAEIILLGDQEKINPFLEQNENIKIIHTIESIDVHEDPLVAVKRKKDSSMVLGLTMLKKGEGDAFVSAGSTGALISGTSLYVGRIKGIRRMSLAAVLPTDKSGVLLIDSGANTDCSAEFLAQFGMMGYIYMKKVLNLEDPRVGLLNIGVEEGKGNAAVKEAYDLLKEMPLNFVGNIEARDVPEGIADVLVADGFTGNVLLKTMEGVAGMFNRNIKAMFKKNALSLLGGLLVQSGIADFKKKMDYTEYGGAPLLGADGVVIKAHGSSNDKAFYHAIRQSITFSKTGVIEEIKNYLTN